MDALAELHTLEQEYQSALTLPASLEKFRKVRLIEQQREGLWAMRRRELAGYTNGRQEGLAETDLAELTARDLAIRFIQVFSYKKVDWRAFAAEVGLTTRELGSLVTGLLDEGIIVELKSMTYKVVD